jgi:DNA-directed RNA polymerase subunit RPC12/RpoP
LQDALKPRQCPACWASLQPAQAGMVVQCPSCGEELVVSIGHRVLIVLVAALLSWAVPALLAKNPAISPLMFIFFFFPGVPLAAQLVTMILPPKYERRSSGVISLFRK